jgi:hypothetical protein
VLRARPTQRAIKVASMLSQGDLPFYSTGL